MNDSSKKQINQKGGFIRIILVIIIILVVSKFIGFSPETIWTNAIVPALEKFWEIIKWIADTLYLIIKILLDLITIGVDVLKRMV